MAVDNLTLPELKLKAALSLTFAIALMISRTAEAQTFTETTDAGQTVGTAQSTGSGFRALTTIFGSLSTSTDADLYRIYISNPSLFSATTFNSGTNDGSLDTELFLFGLTGTGIAANNDDQGGLSLDSTLPHGNSLYASLPAGYYLLGVSNSTNEPVNLNNQLIFRPPTGGDTTSVRGPASGLNPTSMSNFNGNVDDGDGAGAYQIDLTGVSQGPASVSAAPEPLTWALTLFGVGMVGWMSGRGGRRTSRALANRAEKPFHSQV